MLKGSLFTLCTCSGALLRKQVHRVFTSKNSLQFSSSNMEANILKPPVATHLKRLDKDVFTKCIKVPCIKVNGAVVESLRPIIKPFLLKMPCLKPVIYVGEETLILLNPNKTDCWSNLDENVKDRLAVLGLNEENFISTEVNLNYNNWNADDLIRAVLPADMEIMRSFSKVGHIIHLNLRDHLLDYKEIIGQILLDKTSNAKTVVNKTTKIDSTYRNFSMELICGEDNMVTQVKENGVVYEFDFSQVYWNPRLSTEHQRIVDLLSPGDVLFDVFCGVGPFAIPAAKKKCKVFANDLNPNSFTWLNHNKKLNKIVEDNLITFNKDGGEFITNDVKSHLMSLSKDKNFIGKTHVTMNLPALALQFVKFFKHIFRDDEILEVDLLRVIPAIHVYFFVNGTEPQETAKKDFEECTGIPYTEDRMKYQYVRNVSPKKDMVKVSFIPPVNFLIKSTEELGSEEPAAKKVCQDLR